MASTFGRLAGYHIHTSNCRLEFVGDANLAVAASFVNAKVVRPIEDWPVGVGRVIADLCSRHISQKHSAYKCALNENSCNRKLQKKSQHFANEDGFRFV